MAVKLLAWRGNDKKLSKKQVKQVSKIVNKSKKYKMSYTGYAGVRSLNNALAGTWSEMIGWPSPNSCGLNSITEGDESYQRQGDTIMLKHYKSTINVGVNYDAFQGEPASLDADNITLRVVGVRLYGTYTGVPTQYFSNTNINANFIVEKGTVIYDKRILINKSLDTKQMSFNFPCKTKKIPHILVQYSDGDAGTTSLIEKNDIRIFFIYNFPTVPLETIVNSLIIDYSESIGYYDKY